MYVCPVCAYPGLEWPPYALWPPSEGILLEPPYSRMLGAPSYEVCPQCGYEFGNEDDPGTGAPVSFDAYRRDWEASGRRWFSTTVRDPRVSNEPVYACPVCTWPLLRRPYATWPPPKGTPLSPPYDEVLGEPSHMACPQCGYEFGKHDRPVAGPPQSFEDYRRRWVKSGRAALSSFDPNKVPERDG